MLQGQWYDANNTQTLLNKHRKVQWPYHRINILSPNDTEQIKQLLNHLLGTLDATTCIIPPYYCNYGYNIHLTEHVFINTHCIILYAAPVTFGIHTLVGHKGSFYTAVHLFNIAKRNRSIETAVHITVGSNVWIVGCFTILFGVKKNRLFFQKAIESEETKSGMTFRHPA